MSNNKIQVNLNIKWWVKKNKIDIVISLALSIFIFILMFIILGFAANGINTPYVYSQGDETGFYFTVKQVNDTGWIWDYSRVGAPFDNKYNFSYPGFYAMNFDIFVIFIISLFTDNIAIIINIFIIIAFVLSGLCSYIVCRHLRVNYIFSLICSILFALSPYEFWRIGCHLNIIMCCFIPFSILLCFWTFDSSDVEYMKFKRGFFKKGKNVASIILCILIANNGVGYNPIFTCYFILITMVFVVLKEKNLRLIIPAIKNISVIGLSFIIAILPCIVNIINDTTESTERAMVDSELYGLKIAQLFIPVNSHGITIVQKIIDAYNNNMVCINENVSSYLGIAGIVGFLLSLLILISAEKISGCIKEKVILLSRLNIFAVLLGTIGGFSGLIALLFRFIRGYNRISIYILYISLLTLFIVVQNYSCSKSLKRVNNRNAKASLLLIGVLCTVSFCDQIPTIGVRDQQMQGYADAYYSDEEYFTNMESVLGENAKVFQLPYHVFEGGPINQMSAYELFKGYIHTDTLNWSFGKGKGGIEDKWWKMVSCMTVPDMIDTICKAGMSSIYINSKAYAEQELQNLRQEIENVIGCQPIISENGEHIYYDLRDYALNNEIQYDENVFVDCGDVISASSLGINDNCQREYNKIIIQNGGVQYGPYISIEKGFYKISIIGKNLNNVKVDIVCDIGKEEIVANDVLIDDDKVEYTLNISNDKKNVEFRAFNETDVPIEIYYITINKV